ncbi:hypothetical protein ABZ079_36125 [Streptomyces sp. NPDC006314]|uniref:hypothetical protein n=1 Tax=Streptomyces sp. NPDC006314 TaxID=3154475 RepID=UPI0033AD0C04
MATGLRAAGARSPPTVPARHPGRGPRGEVDLWNSGVERRTRVPVPLTAGRRSARIAVRLCPPVLSMAVGVVGATRSRASRARVPGAENGKVRAGVVNTGNRPLSVIA